MSNVTINILTTISLVWIAVLIIAVIIKIAVMISENDTAKLYNFLKKFKKGSCFLVYFAAIPLYFCALYYGGSTVGGAIFTAIDDSISLIVLSFEFDTVAPLAAVNAYYGTVVYICFVSVILNAVLFAVSLAGFRIRNFICKCKALRQKKEIYIVVGYNENNKKIIDSISKKGEKDSRCQELEDINAEIKKLKIEVKIRQNKLKELINKQNVIENNKDSVSDKGKTDVPSIKFNDQIKELKNQIKALKQKKLEVKSKKIKGEYSILLVNESDLHEKDALNLLMIENQSSYMGYETGEFSKLLEKLIAKKKLWDNRAVNIIINCGNGSDNLLLTQELSKFVNNHKDIKHNILNGNGVNGYVFCDPQNTSTFNNYVESTHGAIQYLNKYRLVAMDFISNYPLTKYMTENEIDEKFPALKENVEVNFVMIGFGRLNRQLFHTSISTQQFLSIDKDGNIKEKPVHYCIYDKTDSNADLILNHNYYRYGNFVQQNKDNRDKFLPLPEMPADVQFNKMSISDGEFYNRLQKDLSGAGKYSYIVISYGTDMENLDFGQKIAGKLKEWKLKGKVKLFVKIRNNKLVKNTTNDDMIFFGDESTVVYNIDAILCEGIEFLAKKRNVLYGIEKAKAEEEEQAKIKAEELSKAQKAEAVEDKITEVKTTETRKKSSLKKKEPQENNNGPHIDENSIAEKESVNWYSSKMSQCQRESNIYACLSLRSKLNLIGFDMQKKGENHECENNATKEFLEIYQNGDPINRDENNERNIKYKNSDFDRDSVRKYCAVLEHQRWNANYISWGYVPASKEDIINSEKNGKDATIRRHGCLTTFEGLKAFREIVAKKNLGLKYDAVLEDCDSTRCALENADVIRYDYQIMDDVLWLLDNSDYALVKKEIIKRCAD